MKFTIHKTKRICMQGIKLLELADEEQLFSVLEKTFEYYIREGLDGERLGELIDRLGIDKYREEVLS